LAKAAEGLNGRVMQQVSVIIPCHNGAAYIGEAIASIQSQPVDRIEIIVVDDGSTDGSVAIAKGHGGNVRIIHQARAGASAARQAGIASASGDLVMFCDADDLWATDRLPAQAEFLEATRSDACCGLIQSFLTPELRSDGPGNWTLPPDYFRTFGSLLIRRDSAQRIGRLPEDGPDLHIPFFAALGDLGIHVARFDKVVTLRRVHQSNASRQGSLHFAGYARAIKGALDRRRKMLEAHPASDDQ
jgi:glycosyltransferase involved in cell wall biosynthesis